MARQERARHVLEINICNEEGVLKLFWEVELVLMLPGADDATGRLAQGDDKLEA